VRACSIGWLPGHTTPCAPLVQRRRAQEMTRSQMEVEGRADPSPNFALPASLLRRCVMRRGSGGGQRSATLLVAWRCLRTMCRRLCSACMLDGGPLSPVCHRLLLHSALPNATLVLPVACPRYEVLVKPRSKAPRRKMRDISADCIGALATFKGIVTQVRALGLVLACTAVQPALGVDVAAVWAAWLV